LNNKVKIREFRSSDINEILAFRKTHLGDNRTPEQWAWEFMSSYPDLSAVVLLEDEGSISGIAGRIPIYINIGGKRYLSSKGEGSLLHPKYRGGGWFQKLVEFATDLCKEKGSSCMWGYIPAGLAVKVWRDKLGYTIYENTMYESVLILNLRSTLSGFLKSQRRTGKKIILSLLTLFNYAYSFMYRLYPMPVRKYRYINFSIERKLKSTNDLDMLYARLRGKYPNLIHIDQDAKYLEWRIFNNPHIKYDTYFLYSDSLLRGYCYVGMRDNTRAFLTDFTFETATAGAFLLQNILKNLRHRKVGYVYFLGNIRNSLMMTTFNLLRRFGFLKRRAYGYIFELKNLSYDDENQLYDIKNWYVGGLWTEGVTL